MRWCIGAGTEQLVWNYEGVLDEVRVYGRALEEAEIQALYRRPGGD